MTENDRLIYGEAISRMTTAGERVCVREEKTRQRGMKKRGRKRKMDRRRSD